MKTNRKFHWLLALGVFLAAGATALYVKNSAHGAPLKVEVATGINHDPFDALLKKYVNDKGLVDYAGWKASAADMRALRDYLKQFAELGAVNATGDERAASLINAYNGFTLLWVLNHYPTASIRSLDHSFDKRRHHVGGQMISLDDIEQGNLRELVGFRIHAALVCAALSCPPLRREAFRADTLAAQLDDQMRVWLAREDLNSFSADKKRAEVSSIFKWYAADFEKAGGLKKILAQYAPDAAQEFLQKGEFDVSYKNYNWGLNDQSGKGSNYGQGKLFWDKTKDLFR
jgi:hypothetical protein